MLGRITAILRMWDEPGSGCVSSLLAAGAATLPALFPATLSRLSKAPVAPIRLTGHTARRWTLR